MRNEVPLKYLKRQFFIIVGGAFLVNWGIPASLIAQEENKIELSHENTAFTTHLQEKDIVNIISQEKEKYNLKSVFFEVWQDNECLASGVLGESMEGVPATKDMHFRIGGVTETLLTTLLLQLVDEGKVKLDDPISKWLPDLPNSQRVTLKMLANSTSGYPDYEKSAAFVKAFEKAVFKRWSTSELLAYAFAKPPLFAPGSKWSYAHTNYVLLGEALEKITHQSISQLLQEKIFNKLGLTHSHASMLPEIKPPALHAYSSERGVYEDSTYWSPSWTSFSGLVSSNIEDLGKWIRAFGSGALLSEEAHKAMITAVSINKDDPKMGFGLGFGIVNSWFIQNPRFGGYSGFFAYLPPKKLAIVVYNTLNPQTSNEVNYSQVVVAELVKKMAPDYLLPKSLTSHSSSKK